MALFTQRKHGLLNSWCYDFFLLLLLFIRPFDSLTYSKTKYNCKSRRSESHRITVRVCVYIGVPSVLWCCAIGSKVASKRDTTSAIFWSRLYSQLTRYGGRCGERCCEKHNQKRETERREIWSSIAFRLERWSLLCEFVSNTLAAYEIPILFDKMLNNIMRRPQRMEMYWIDYFTIKYDLNLKYISPPKFY